MSDCASVFSIRHTDEYDQIVSAGYDVCINTLFVHDDVVLWRRRFVWKHNIPALDNRLLLARFNIAENKARGDVGRPHAREVSDIASDGQVPRWSMPIVLIVKYNFQFASNNWHPRDDTSKYVDPSAFLSPRFDELPQGSGGLLLARGQSVFGDNYTIGRSSESTKTNNNGKYPIFFFASLMFFVASFSCLCVSFILGNGSLLLGIFASLGSVMGAVCVGVSLHQVLN